MKTITEEDRTVTFDEAANMLGYKITAKKPGNTAMAYYCTLFENVSPCGRILAKAAGIFRFLVSATQ